MKRAILLVIVLCMQSIAIAQTVEKYDLVIYGGTSAGVSAAIQASRMGKTVVLIEPTNRIGGLTTGGLGQTDIGNKQAIGGIAREFYQECKKILPATRKLEMAKTRVSTRWRPNPHRFGRRCHVDFRAFGSAEDFSPDAQTRKKYQLVYKQRLDRKNGVTKKKGVITSIAMESGEVYSGKVFIDATYEGDLMASAGVSYTVGRESNKQYGETLNGIHTADTARTMTNQPSRNSINHNFVHGVDPYVEKGNPKSGLLPFINPKGPGEEGSAR